MPDDFVIAVASGKGGTGKTTIAVNLARMISESGRKVQYLDCDVEEPNGHIFLRPQITACRQITVDVPQVDPRKCTACGKCGEICQFGAIVCIKEDVLVFEELCHSCHGCVRICPDDAIKAKSVEIGTVECGTADEIDFVHGRLRIGHVRSPSLIKEVKKHIRRDCPAVLDAPPGTSCPVVEAVKDTDFVLLVTEPTPFGLNDLKLAVDLVRRMNLPFAVIVNRCDMGDRQVEQYCETEGITIIAKLPDDRRISEVYSSGRMIVQELPEYGSRFMDIAEQVKALV